MNARQQRFVAEYLKDLNATRAAKAAGYSPKGAEVTGCKLLRNAKVAKAVAAAQQKRAARVEVDQDRVLEGLVTEATREGKGSQHGARVTAWGLLARHFGMLVDRHEIETGAGGVRVVVRAAEPAAKEGA